MADETTEQRAIGATSPPVRGRRHAPSIDGADGGTPPADEAADAGTEARRRRREQRGPIVQVAGREGGDVSRTSPRMRFDLLQLAAVAVGLSLLVAGLVALARAGFDDLGLFEPVVEVGGQAATPLYAGLWLLVGVIVLAAGSGSVDERRLRSAGIVSGIVGAVFLIEPDAFGDYLGVTAESGRALLAVGALLVATSFVPPLSIVRPGTGGD